MLERISKDDWQYIVPFLLCTICFIATDVIGIIGKTSVAYWSGRLFVEPYRVVTSHFFHVDINHFFANSSGIIVARYFFKALNLRSNYFLIAIVFLLIPIQSIICWCIDILVCKNANSIAIGFSGILYGVYAIILLTTIYGKKKFIFLECGLGRNPNLIKSISVITGIGLILSFLPGISLIGHLSGLLAGIVVFLL